MKKTSYRHNAMNINSIDAFLNIRGGVNNGVRDVYFIRALGEPENLIKSIEDIDNHMNMEMSKKKLIYKRIGSLPKIRNIEDSDYYLKEYISFVEQNRGSLRQIHGQAGLEQAISSALLSCISVYKEARDELTVSMQKNFGIKLLFWLDCAVGDCLNDWSEKACIKIIADNVMKEQEFLFYLFLTYLGCDVILIENRGDISIDKSLIKYSSELKLGEYGNSVLGQYLQNVPETEEGLRKTKAWQRSTEQVPGNNRVVENNGEKNFEELALLASSVVLIAIHDRDGGIIGTGSGIMIGREGYILTNNHVASGGFFYSVRIEEDNEVYTTNEVIKYNSCTDLAILRIDRELNPIPIYQGKKLVRGQKVVAIGSPLGLFNSVSDGIISGFRKINDVDMIQFTAPISSGSSGGAVLNMQGEVIGISTAGIDSGQNINLAIGYENIRLFTNSFTC